LICKHVSFIWKWVKIYSGKLIIATLTEFTKTLQRRADMINTKIRFETGEIAMEPGKFVCKAGISQNFYKGEEFPVCPISHRDTTWELIN
jgi:hypothetical protein